MVSDSQDPAPEAEDPDEKTPVETDSTRDPGAKGAAGPGAGAGDRGERGLGELSLGALTERLAATAPVPGAGSGAAAIAAVGASLVSMAFRRTFDEGASGQGAYMNGRAESLERLRVALLSFVDRDAEAYNAFLAARAMDKGSDAARAKRRAALESAARTTIEVPFEILEAALAGLRLAAVGAPHQHPNLLCETATGAQALFASVESCARIVRENLPIAAVESGPFAEQHGRALRALVVEAAKLLEEVRAATAPDDGSSPAS